MNYEYVLKAKKELNKFLKLNKGYAAFFCSIYGCENNERKTKATLENIGNANSLEGSYGYYCDLIGKMASNPNIKDRVYWRKDPLYKLYIKWLDYINNNIRKNNII